MGSSGRVLTLFLRQRPLHRQPFLCSLNLVGRNFSALSEKKKQTNSFTPGQVLGADSALLQKNKSLMSVKQKENPPPSALNPLELHYLIFEVGGGGGAAFCPTLGYKNNRC